jgi:hypothetical protein
VDLHTRPLDYAGAVAQRLLQEETPYDILFNFAALEQYAPKSTFIRFSR